MSSTVPAMPVGQSLTLPADVYADVAQFVRELHAQGVIKAEDWKGAAESNAGEVLLDLVQLGAQRIVDEAAAMMPASASDYEPFYVAPQALANIAHGSDFGGLESEPDAGKTLVATTGQSPFITIPTPVTAEEMSAICCVLVAINEKSGNWMIVPPDQVVEVLDPMLWELVTDLKVALRGQKLTAATLPASMRGAIEDWYGEIPGDPELANAMFESLNAAVEAARDVEKWHMGDGKIEAWLERAEGTNVQLVQRLYDFWKPLPQFVRRVEREVLGDGHCTDLFVMSEATWECHQGVIQGMADWYDPVEVFRIKRKTGRAKAGHVRSTCPQVDSFRDAVMATTVATATTRIIIDACAD
ncbi:hypothetical protein ACQHIH_21670 (plasmid) [Xanthomonas sontii]|uniref:hypothetical protein n=1 Tax=Xanthomonas sontii TaxID=2650745 RepID=UPI003F851539